MPAPFDPASLPDDPKLLREMLLLLMGQLKEKDERIEKLTFWVKEFRQRQFGRKSESITEENQQLMNFLIEGVAARKPEPRPEAPPPPAPEKKGHGRARIPKELLRDVVVHDVPKKDQRCTCCRKKLVLIGEVATEQVEYEPASVHVKKDVRLKYGCPDEECRGTIVLAELPPRPVPKCKAAEGMLAFVVMNKYGHHLPLFRQEEILANHGFPVQRSTLWEWVRGAAEALEPVYTAMKKMVQGSPVIETDETPVALWDPERKVLKKGRQWVYNTPAHTVFEFSRDRKKEHPKAFLADSKGYLLSDAYAGYRSIAKESGNLVNVFCWAHYPN
jgi:transposase